VGIFVLEPLWVGLVLGGAVFALIGGRMPSAFSLMKKYQKLSEAISFIPLKNIKQT
jgi:hypothetical protein